MRACGDPPCLRPDLRVRRARSEFPKVVPQALRLFRLAKAAARTGSIRNRRRCSERLCLPAYPCSCRYRTPVRSRRDGLATLSVAAPLACRGGLSHSSGLLMRKRRGGCLRQWSCKIFTPADRCRQVASTSTYQERAFGDQVDWLGSPGARPISQRMSSEAAVPLTAKSSPTGLYLG